MCVCVCVCMPTDRDVLVRHPKQHGGLDMAQRRLQTRLELLHAVAKGRRLQQERERERERLRERERVGSHIEATGLPIRMNSVRPCHEFKLEPEIKSKSKQKHPNKCTTSASSESPLSLLKRSTKREGGGGGAASSSPKVNCTGAGAFCVGLSQLLALIHSWFMMTWMFWVGITCSSVLA